MLSCLHLTKFVTEGEFHIILGKLINSINYICSIILDADPASVQKRVDLRNDELPLGEQTVAQVTNAIHGLFW